MLKKETIGAFGKGCAPTVPSYVRAAAFIRVASVRVDTPPVALAPGLNASSASLTPGEHKRGPNALTRRPTPFKLSVCLSQRGKMHAARSRGSINIAETAVTPLLIALSSIGFCCFLCQFVWIGFQLLPGCGDAMERYYATLIFTQEISKTRIAE